MGALKISIFSYALVAQNGWMACIGRCGCSLWLYLLLRTPIMEQLCQGASIQRAIRATCNEKTEVNRWPDLIKLQPPSATVSIHSILSIDQFAIISESIISFHFPTLQRAIGHICTSVPSGWHRYNRYDRRIEKDRKRTGHTRGQSKEFETTTQQSKLYYQRIRNFWYQLHSIDLSVIQWQPINRINFSIYPLCESNYLLFHKMWWHRTYSHGFLIWFHFLLIDSQHNKTVLEQDFYIFFFFSGKEMKQNTYFGCYLETKFIYRHWTN